MYQVEYIDDNADNQFFIFIFIEDTNQRGTQYHMLLINSCFVTEFFLLLINYRILEILYFKRSKKLFIIILDHYIVK